MRVRLGFAIAIHCEPDILLVDEILSVGDLGFKNKSLRRMAEYREKANGIIFVSHDLEQIRVLCDKVMILNAGKIIFQSETHNALIQYEEMTRDSKLKSQQKDIIQTNPDFKLMQSSKEDTEFIDIGIMNNNEDKIHEINMDEPLRIFVDFKVLHDLEDLFFSVGVLDDRYKSCIWVMSNDNHKAQFKNIKEGKYRLITTIPQHHLIPNVYIPNIGIRNGISGETYERVWPKNSFIVRANKPFLERGIIAVEEQWELKKIEL